MAKNSKNNNGGCTGCIGTIFVLLIIAIIIGGCSSCGNSSDDNGNEDAKSSKIEKSKSKSESKSESIKSSKEEKKQNAQIKDANEAIGQDLAAGPDWATYINKIKYNGDAEAEVTVNDDFTLLSNAQKNIIAKSVNNEVIANAVDDEDADSAMLVFIYNGDVIGRSKYLNHSEYKWEDK